ncbi:MAG: HD domain-containing protein [Magnetococcales bacterium]|nr:HD domain-containing protein [Magnetococcales bacterium]
MLPKSIRFKNKAENPEPDAAERVEPWLVLVVDDDPDIVAITGLNLRNFSFSGRRLELMTATSAAAARSLLASRTGVALAIIDIVMETDDAGLQLVRFIREELGDDKMRLVIRTGQPGYAPERYIIDNFDIDDYKEKGELSAQKLYTTVRSSLKSYRDLMTIDATRRGLEAVLQTMPQIYLHSLDGFERFYATIWDRMVALCALEHAGGAILLRGCLAVLESGEWRVKAGSGCVCDEALWRRVQERTEAGETLLPLRMEDRLVGWVYLEHAQPLSSVSVHVLRIFMVQVVAAWQVLRAQLDLREANVAALRMLAEAAEVKDAETGEHVCRVVEWTRRLSLAMGLSAEVADAFATASRLHDVGKIGVPDRILNKQGPLDPEEFAVIRTHAQVGGLIIQDEKNFRIAREIALYHHEKWNGTGYPQGLKGEEIPLSARIVSVVDVFDALMSRRPYKEPWKVDDAASEIRRLSGVHFDPRVVEAFLRLLAREQPECGMER